jgi:hypothetical protein
MNLSGSEWRQATGCIEYVNEFSRSSKAGIFLTGWTAITLSRRTLPQAVLKYRRSRVSSSGLPIASARLILRSWRWRRYLPPKKRRLLSEVQDVTSHKKELLTVSTASSVISSITYRGCWVSTGRIMRKRNVHFKSHSRMISPLMLLCLHMCFLTSIRRPPFLNFFALKFMMLY